jgi:phage-related protein
MPREVQRTMGIALWFAQLGALHPTAKPMKGKHLAGVIEIREDFDHGTFRLMYTAKLGAVIYALCAFQKKATKGIATPKHLVDRVAERLRQTRRIHERQGGGP